MYTNRYIEETAAQIGDLAYFGVITPIVAAILELAGLSTAFERSGALMIAFAFVIVGVKIRTELTVRLMSIDIDKIGSSTYAITPNKARKRMSDHAFSSIKNYVQSAEYTLGLIGTLIWGFGDLIPFPVLWNSAT